LNSLAGYVPRDAREAESIAERVTARLQHANSAVVLAAVRVLMSYLDAIQSPEIVRVLCKKMSAPLGMYYLVDSRIIFFFFFLD
jgi:AP-1 complex subunit beta-1